MHVLFSYENIGGTKREQSAAITYVMGAQRARTNREQTVTGMILAERTNHEQNKA